MPMHFDIAQVLLLNVLAGTFILLAAEFMAALRIAPKKGAVTARVVAVILVAVAALHAAPSVARDSDDGENLHLATKSGLHFYAGGEIDVTEPAASLFAAGGRIDVDSKNIGEMITAGGKITLRDVATDRVIAAGGKVEINGVINKSLIATGGRVMVGEGSKISGDVILTGGKLSLKGDVGGDLIATGGKVDIAARIEGDATLRAREIELAPGTRIAGKLTYSSSTELQIPAGVEVVGTVARQDWDGGRSWGGHFSIGNMIVAAILAVLGTMVALFLFAAIILLFFTPQIDRASAAITTQPLQSLGLGALLVIVLPVTAIILFITLIGIPLGLFALAAYGVLFGLGIIVAAHWTGLKARRLATGNQDMPAYGARLAWTFVGLVLFSIVGLVPIIGNLAQFFALITGFGAFILAITANNTPRVEAGAAA
jgi:cytoskeletal protein CcmA (bactofilin family)